jgi:hypothetical protein
MSITHSPILPLSPPSPPGPPEPRTLEPPGPPFPTSPPLVLHGFADASPIEFGTTSTVENTSAAATKIAAGRTFLSFYDH